jgi:hypothetical protein
MQEHLYEVGQLARRLDNGFAHETQGFLSFLKKDEGQVALPVKDKELVGTALAAVFLYSRAGKLPLLPLMIHYFGAAYTLVLCLYLLGVSIINGVSMVKLEDRETTWDIFELF